MAAVSGRYQHISKAVGDLPLAKRKLKPNERYVLAEYEPAYDNPSVGDWYKAILNRPLPAHDRVEVVYRAATAIVDWRHCIMTVVAPTPDGRDFVGKQWDFSNVEPGKTGIFQCKDWEWRPKSRFLALGTTTMDDAAINAQAQQHCTLFPDYHLITHNCMTFVYELFERIKFSDYSGFKTWLTESQKQAQGLNFPAGLRTY